MSSGSIWSAHARSARWWLPLARHLLGAYRDDLCALWRCTRLLTRDTVAHPHSRAAEDDQWALCLFPATASQYGVTLQAEAVANSKHTLYLIAEAGDEEQLRRYLTPFAQAGSVEVLPASPCEAVIDRGGCAPVPA